MSKTLRLTLEPLEDRIVMDTYTVVRLGDSGVGRGFRGDLRYCITQANAVPGEDLIIFGKTGTINLNQALPDLSDDLNIAGPGADQLTVRRNTDADYRIFTIAAGKNVQIYSMTISNGLMSAIGGSSSWGGGIRNSGVLTLGASAVTNNHLVGQPGKRGGGISNEGTMLIFDSTIASNETLTTSSGGNTLAAGGGIHNQPGATLTITNSTVSGNSAVAELGTCCMKSARGAGVYNEGSLTIRHSTISANTASGTITEGAGVYNWPGGTAFIVNSIIAGNTGESELEGTFSGSTNLIGGDPMLGPLADNGGPTHTMALLPGSPAIDAGDNTGAPEFDQRGPGFPRIVNGTVDIGAFEVQSSPIPPSRRPGHDILTLILATADLDTLT